MDSGFPDELLACLGINDVIRYLEGLSRAMQKQKVGAVEKASASQARSRAQMQMYIQQAKGFGADRELVESAIASLRKCLSHRSGKPIPKLRSEPEPGSDTVADKIVSEIMQDEPSDEDPTRADLRKAGDAAMVQMYDAGVAQARALEKISSKPFSGKRTMQEIDREISQMRDELAVEPKLQDESVGSSRPSLPAVAGKDGGLQPPTFARLASPSDLKIPSLDPKAPAPADHRPQSARKKPHTDPPPSSAASLNSTSGPLNSHMIRYPTVCDVEFPPPPD